MIAPLEFIFGGGNDDVPTKMSGGAIETFSKKCDEIKDKYGVPIGYSCIYTHTREYKPEPIPYLDHERLEEPDINEIDDDMFDTLFVSANETKKKARVTTRRKTNRKKTTRRQRHRRDV